MDKVLVISLVAATAEFVWSQNVTRTPKLEILRSPTKVAIWKPDPYPVLRSYGDEEPAPTVNNLTISRTQSSSRSLNTTAGVHNETVTEEMASNSTLPSNATVLESSPKNTTCIRRDYGDDIVAVFTEDVGPIHSAEIVFNSTIDFPNGRITNVTGLAGLQVLNETTIDCGLYFPEKITTNNTLGTNNVTES